MRNLFDTKQICRSSIIWVFGIVVCFTLCVDGHAQNIVRCGNLYQDHPCDDGQTGKIIGKLSNSESDEKPAVDSSCVQRGINAQKMVWAREGGMTQDRMQQKASNEGQGDLVAEVYNNRGSAMEVRAAVQASCVAAKAIATANAGKTLMVIPNNMVTPNSMVIPNNNTAPK